MNVNLQVGWVVVKGCIGNDNMGGFLCGLQVRVVQAITGQRGTTPRELNW